MRSLFWINFCLAVFFAGMLVIMTVVVLLYGLNLDLEQTSRGEFNGALVFAALLGLFVSCLGATAFGLYRERRWWWLPQLGTVSMAAAGVLFIQQIAA